MLQAHQDLERIEKGKARDETLIAGLSAGR